MKGPYDNFPLLKILEQKYPGEDMVYAAVHSLKKPKEIRDFYIEYRRFYGSAFPELSGVEIEKEVNTNIAYRIVTYGDRKSLWKKTLPFLVYALRGPGSTKALEGYSIKFRSYGPDVDDMVRKKLLESISLKAKIYSLYHDPRIHQASPRNLESMLAEKPVKKKTADCGHDENGCLEAGPWNEIQIRMEKGTFTPSNLFFYLLALTNLAQQYTRARLNKDLEITIDGISGRE